MPTYPTKLKLLMKNGLWDRKATEQWQKWLTTFKKRQTLGRKPEFFLISLMTDSG